MTEEEMKERCSDCACLFEGNGKWCCDQWECECVEITKCPEWYDN